MKIRYILSLLALSLFFTSCEEPMAEINDEIDSLKVNYVTSNLQLTLTDANLVTDMKVGQAYFSDEKPAINYVPAFLTKFYPAMGKASRAILTYKYKAPTVDMVTPYVLKAADYTFMGQSNPNFSDKAAALYLITGFLNARMYSDVPKQLTVKYVFYSTGNSRYFRVNADKTVEEVTSTTDANPHPLTADDYDLVGRGQYDNFNDLADALALMDDLATARTDALPKVYKAVVFKNYYDNYYVFTYNGATWAQTPTTINVTTEYLHNGTTWIIAPQLAFETTTDAHTFEYTLTNADYALVGNGKYNNFDVYSGGQDESIEARIVKITTILKANFIDLAENDVFLVHYKGYDKTATVVYDIKLKAVLK